MERTRQFPFGVDVTYFNTGFICTVDKKTYYYFYDGESISTQLYGKLRGIFVKDPIPHAKFLKGIQKVLNYHLGGSWYVGELYIHHGMTHLIYKVADGFIFTKSKQGDQLYLESSFEFIPVTYPPPDDIYEIEL